MRRMSFAQFVLNESKNSYVESIKTLVDKIKEDRKENSDKEDLEEFGEKVLKSLKKIINIAVKEDVYLESKELIKDIEDILKDAKISDKLVSAYFDAGLNPTKRESFEAKVRADVAETKSAGKSEKESGDKDEDETDEDIKKKAKENAKDDSKLEKEVEKEAEEDSKKKVVKKILLGIVDKKDDGEITKGIVLDTDLPAKKIEGLEYREDVLAAGFNAKNLKTPAEISRYAKKLGGTSIYWFDFDNTEYGDDVWKVVSF
jgi:hypothetical protein